MKCDPASRPRVPSPVLRFPDPNSLTDEQLDKLFCLSVGEPVKAEEEEEEDRLKELEELEKPIASSLGGAKNFYQIGLALIEIRAKKLYKQAGYSSFIAYCNKRFEVKKAVLYQYINSVEVLDSLGDEQKTSAIADKEVRPRAVCDAQGNAHFNVLTEYHCRELGKIGDRDLRKETFHRAIATGNITAKVIAETYRQIKLEKANQRNLPVLPEVGQIVKLNKRYRSYWAIATQINEFGVNAICLDGEIENIPAQDFHLIDRVDCSGARELLDRLMKLYRPKLDPTAKLVIEAIASKPIPTVTRMEEKLLGCISIQNLTSDPADF
ncbi:MAG: hypothetical protein F6K35_43655 [Okeania sp. SIO2H7]|nr:hypothetical protein [Okeania sp. SIO2H7]